MKHNLFKVTFALLFCIVSSSIEAHSWHALNKANKTLIVQVELLHSKNPYFCVVRPNESANFDWPIGNGMAGFCLGAIKYVIADDALLNETSIIKNKQSVTDNGKMLRWLDQHKDKYPRILATVTIEAPSGYGMDKKSLYDYRCMGCEGIVITEQNGTPMFTASFTESQLKTLKKISPIPMKD